MSERATTLARMYSLFSQDKRTGWVNKSKFWECAERLGASMSKQDIDQCFKLFDKTGRGFFTFNDFTRVSKLVQGFEIDQLFYHGDKTNAKIGGKRCKGFSERQKIEYDA